MLQFVGLQIPNEQIDANDDWYDVNCDHHGECGFAQNRVVDLAGTGRFLEKLIFIHNFSQFFSISQFLNLFRIFMSFKFD
jgi:hypothetical protein